MPETLPYALPNDALTTSRNWLRLGVVVGGFVPWVFLGCLGFEYAVAEPVSLGMFKFYHVLAVVMPLFWLAWLVSIFFLWRSGLGRLVLVCCVIWAGMHLLMGALFLKHVREEDPAGEYYRTQWP